jgi:putative ABC transport system permease protein
VTQRQHEIGIRMALGALPRAVVLLVIRQGMKWVAAGLALGLLCAFALTRVMRSLLYQVQPTDPIAFATVSLLFLAVALIACWWPARRAAETDPLVILRYE